MRMLTSILCSLLTISLASCMQTSQEALVGRWFNSSNSIRFNPDGTLTWNARQGLATGVYRYNGQARPTTSGEAVNNLDMNLVAGGESRIRHFEVQIMANKRLRLMPIADDGTPGTQQLIILKRAAAEDRDLFAEAMLPDLSIPQR